MFREKILKTYPYPIAYRYRCIVQDQHDERYLLDQLLKCAEITDRYLAALTIASFAAREDISVAPPVAFADFAKQENLSWGHFGNIIRAVEKSSAYRPLRNEFSACLYSKRSEARDKLSALQKIRNSVSHNFDGFRNASEILEREKPVQLLNDILEEIEPLCKLPLFRVENLPSRKKVDYARFYSLMGDQGNPIPEDEAVNESFLEDQIYVGLPQGGALSLHPIFVWDPKRSQTGGLHVLDHIKDELGYTAVADASEAGRIPQLEELKSLLRGDSVPFENINFINGTSFYQYWNDIRSKALERLFIDQIQYKLNSPQDTFLRGLYANTGNHFAEIVLEFMREFDSGGMNGFMWHHPSEQTGLCWNDDKAEECWLTISISGDVTINTTYLWSPEPEADELPLLEKAKKQLYEKLKAFLGKTVSDDAIREGKFQVAPALLKSSQDLLLLADAYVSFQDECMLFPSQTKHTLKWDGKDVF